MFYHQYLKLAQLLIDKSRSIQATSQFHLDITKICPVISTTFGKPWDDFKLIRWRKLKVTILDWPSSDKNMVFK